MSPKSDKQFEDIRESSKENILDSALKLFSSNGYFNTSTRAIAKHAKISNGLLYNYFKSKEDLLIEIVNKSFKVFDDTADSQGEGPAVQKVEQIIERFFKLVDGKQKLIRMMAQMGLQTNKFDFINQMIMKKYKLEIVKIEALLKEIDPKSGKVDANILMATLDGIMFQVLVMGEVIPTNEMKKALIQKYTSTKAQ